MKSKSSDKERFKEVIKRLIEELDIANGSTGLIKVTTLYTRTYLFSLS